MNRKYKNEANGVIISSSKGWPSKFLVVVQSFQTS